MACAAVHPQRTQPRRVAASSHRPFHANLFSCTETTPDARDLRMMVNRHLFHAICCFSHDCAKGTPESFLARGLERRKEQQATSADAGHANKTSMTLTGVAAAAAASNSWLIRQPRQTTSGDHLTKRFAHRSVTLRRSDFFFRAALLLLLLAAAAAACCCCCCNVPRRFVRKNLHASFPRQRISRTKET